MKVYISLPMSGRDLDECRAQAEATAEAVSLRGHEAITPFDVVADPGHTTYAQALGQDVTALLGCDAVMLLGDWEASRGCRLEACAAAIFDLAVYGDPSQLDPPTPNEP